MVEFENVSSSFETRQQTIDKMLNEKDIIGNEHESTKFEFVDCDENEEEKKY